jgi:hypothetical protein
MVIDPNRSRGHRTVRLAERRSRAVRRSHWAVSRTTTTAMWRGLETVQTRDFI